MWLWTQPDVDWDNLQAHLDEFTFRHNHRSEPTGAVFQRLVLAALRQSDSWAKLDRDVLRRSA